MGLTVYNPTSVILDGKRSTVRHVPPHEVFIDPDVPLNDSELQRYDRTTIFYDIFVDLEGSRIVALGPPLYNLESILLPMVFSIRSDSSEPKFLSYTITRRSNYWVYTFPLRNYRALAIREGLSSCLKFANGLEYSLCVRPIVASKVGLSLSTLQKNNSINWIVDWVAYWQSLGVERVILYDNGSDDFDDLVSRLSAQARRVDIIVVTWPFNYGPTRSYELCFTQWGSLNHARLAFGNSSWMAAFDIDEYPVLGSAERDLNSWLSGQSFHIGQILVEPYGVLNYSGDSALTRPVSVRDFNFRYRERGNSLKYFFRPRRAKTCNVHNAVTNKLGTKRADIHDLCYFHYIGLTDGWRAMNRLEQTSPTPDLHVEDRSVSAKFLSLDM